MPEWLIPIFVGLVVVAVFCVAHWYFEVYTTRKHWREAVAETDAQFDAEYGVGWRDRAKRGHIPPRQLPPTPSPMADMTYGCAEHYYYGGKCPNCERVSGVMTGEREHKSVATDGDYEWWSWFPIRPAGVGMLPDAGGWHAPGIGEVHNGDHTIMIDVMVDNPAADSIPEYQPGYLPSDAIAQRLAALLNANPGVLKE